MSADGDEYSFDDFEDDIEDELDDENECGRWVNGGLSHFCSKAGSEWCDWDCPIGLPKGKP